MLNELCYRLRIRGRTFVRYHLVIQALLGPLAVGPREWENPPQVGSHITETVEGEQMQLEIFGLQHLPIIPGGIFAHEETWVMCKVL